MRPGRPRSQGRHDSAVGKIRSTRARRRMSAMRRLPVGGLLVLVRKRWRAGLHRRARLNRQAIEGRRLLDVRLDPIATLSHLRGSRTVQEAQVPPRLQRVFAVAEASRASLRQCSSALRGRYSKALRRKYIASTPTGLSAFAAVSTGRYRAMPCITAHPAAMCRRGGAGPRPALQHHRTARANGR